MAYCRWGSLNPLYVYPTEADNGSDLLVVHHASGAKMFLKRTDALRLKLALSDWLNDIQDWEKAD